MHLRLLSAIVAALLIVTLTSSCGRDTERLPILGTFAADFSLLNQDGEAVTPELFTGKIYVTDFFFTTCPTICPIMTVQMARVYETFQDDPGVLLLSHTIDPEHDTVAVLHDYASRMDINSAKWHMVTAPKNIIYPLAKQYMLGVVESDQAPGGFIHSGSFCLVDRQGNIRGYYNGTDSQEVDRLIEDIRFLLQQ